MPENNEAEVNEFHKRFEVFSEKLVESVTEMQEDNNSNNHKYSIEDIVVSLGRLKQKNGFPHYTTLLNIINGMKSFLGTGKYQLTRIQNDILFLLGLADQPGEYQPIGSDEDEKGGIRWLQRQVEKNFQESAKGKEIDQFLSVGLDFFLQITKNGMSESQCLKFLQSKSETFDQDYVIRSFQSLLMSGNLRILDVPYKILTQKQLKEHASVQSLTDLPIHNLDQIVVVRLPRQATPDQYCDSGVIATELVSFVASRHILSQNISNVIGIGGGTTMKRFAYNSVPSPQTTNEIVYWFPIQVFYTEEGIIDPLSSNGIVSILNQRHPYSNALYAPYLSLDDRIKATSSLYSYEVALKGKLEARDRLLNYEMRVDPIILSVGTIKQGRFTPSDGSRNSYQNVSSLYKQLTKTERKEAVGEILGYIVDKDGHPVTKLPENIKTQDAIVYSLDLDKLATNKNVWFVAAGLEKAQPLRAAIRRYANNLVIDELLMEELFGFNPFYEN